MANKKLKRPHFQIECEHNGKTFIVVATSPAAVNSRVRYGVGQAKLKDVLKLTR